MTPCIIAIAGPSGSGKSLFAQTIMDEVHRSRPGIAPVLLKEDAYYRDQGHMPLEARAGVNYDHPDAIEQELLCQHLRQLREGRAVPVPRYDYTVHTRHEQCDEVSPAPVVIVEGILLLSNPLLRDVFDIRFFMDTALDVCLLRRIQRDQRERGRTLESIIEQYESTVRPMHQQFIAPSARHADMIITGGGRNRVALDIVRDMVLSRLEGGATAASGESGDRL